MTEFIQILTTVDSQNAARKIASELLAQRVAGCVQVYGPVKSSYWWKGKIENAKEWSCLAKTVRRNYPDAESIIRKVHPYAVPEILAFPVLTGSSEYLKWLRKETRGRKPTMKRS